MGRQLPFFPTPYPDELLLSVFARYQLRSCNLSIRQTLNDLIGSHSSILKEFPSRLNNLIERLPSLTAITLKELIQKHTILPYYKPFIAPKWLDASNLDMHEEETTFHVDPVVDKFHTGKYLNKTLRYCPKCYSSDEKKYGEPYWHRSHQVLGVLRCHKHNEWLVDSKIKFKTVRTENSLFPLGPEALSDKSNIRDSRDIRLHDWLAKKVYWLLNGNNAGIPCHPKILLKRYRYHLRKVDLITRSGSLLKAKLRKNLLNYYGMEFLEDICCPLDGDSIVNCITELFRSSKRHLPLFHLLAMQFLGVDPEDILWDQNETNQPFGQGPWPCLNKAADHYCQLVIKECSISKASRTNFVTGTFSCECGFSYERFGPDSSSTDRSTFDKIITTGDLWDKKLLQLYSKGRNVVGSNNLMGAPKYFVVENLFRLLEETHALIPG